MVKNIWNRPRCHGDQGKDNRNLGIYYNVRLDYRISSLLTIFKRDFDESNAGLAEMNGENGIVALYQYGIVIAAYLNEPGSIIESDTVR